MVGAKPRPRLGELSVAERNRRVRDLYRRAPALTHALTAHHRTDAGCNGYELLSRVLDTTAASAPTVLDLACGGGDLYRYCADRIANGYWIGVDVVDQQIASARRKWPHADWRCESAQELSSIGDATIDVALCKGALTEFLPLDPAIREVARVLRPGGTFAALVQINDEPSPSWPGDPRSYTRDGLESLFETPLFEGLQLREHRLLVRERLDSLWRLLRDRSCQLGVLSRREQQRRRRETMAPFTRMADEDGIVAIYASLMLVRAQRTGTDIRP